MSKRKKKEEAKPLKEASSPKRALAEKWAEAARLWPELSEDSRAVLVQKASELSREELGPKAFCLAFSKAEGSRAQALLELAAFARPPELLSSLEEISRKPLALSLALLALEALQACGGKADETELEELRRASQARAELLEALETSDPERARQCLEDLGDRALRSLLIEVFQSLGPEGWKKAGFLAGLSPRLDEALLDALGSLAELGAESLELLRRLASGPEKATAKAARALIHKLKSRGLEVEEKEAPSVWSPPSAETFPGEALITGFDRMGNRLIWLALSSSARAIHVGYGIVSDIEGLLSFSWGAMGRKQLAEVKADLEAEHARREIPLVALEPKEAQARLETAARITQDRGKPLPEAYLEFVRHHPPPAQEPKALIYEVLEPELVERARHSTSSSPALLDDPQTSVAFWPIEAEAVAEAASSGHEERLIIVPGSPLTEPEDEEASACDRLFSGELFERLLKRLEEQAYVFWASGQQERALLHLACTVAFRDDPSTKPSSHAFWRLWARRLLQAFREAQHQEASRERLILTPEEAAAEAARLRGARRPRRRP